MLIINHMSKFSFTTEQKLSKSAVQTAIDNETLNYDNYGTVNKKINIIGITKSFDDLKAAFDFLTEAQHAMPVEKQAFDKNGDFDDDK